MLQTKEKIKKIEIIKIPVLYTVLTLHKSPLIRNIGYKESK